MKMRILFVFTLSLFLVACSEETKQVDYEALYEEYYSDVEYTVEEWMTDICQGVDEGIELHIEIEYVYPFDNLSEMIASDSSNFVYGEVFKIEEFNCISDSVYMIVYDSEFEDDRKLIRVSNIPSDVILVLGKSYILNLIYDEDNDRYSLSQVTDSVFTVASSNILQGAFLTPEYPNEVDAFIAQVFKD